jgi:DNA-binding transcriptional LysR family regulator
VEREDLIRVSLTITRLKGLFDIPTDRLSEGSLQFALGLFPQPIVPGRGIASQLLFDDPWVCLARINHPQIKNNLSLSNFLRIEHIRVCYAAPERPGLIGAALTSIGRSRTVAVTVPHLASVPAIAARSDLLGIVPLRLAREYAETLGLKIYRIPLSLPRTTLALLWHENNQHDPAHIWIREKIARFATRLQSRVE